MYKLPIGILIGIILGLVGHYGLDSLLSRELISSDFARVTIRNESGQGVKKISLQHERGTLSATGLKNMEEVRFIFENHGENAYKVAVTLDNEQTLVSNEVYFELGYRAIERIMSTNIITENNW